MLKTDNKIYNVGHEHDDGFVKMDPIDEMVRARAVLAPMSGITDIPFRMMARKFGCRFAFTEMIDVNGIVYSNRKSFKLMDRACGDDPIGVQIVGADENKLLYVAQVCEEKGFDVLDINAGCPARKVVKSGKGSALLKDPVKIARIIRMIVSKLKIPVTVKIRSGWDEDSLNYLEVAKAAASEGASSICIHSRTREQMYKGKVRHDIAGAVKKAMDIPVFASGNIFTAQDAFDVYKDTGCDGVYIARGALGRPWIFSEINNMFFSDGSGDVSFGGPLFVDIKKIMIDHFSICREYYEGKWLVSRMYKHVAWYLKGLKNLNEVMKEYRTVSDLASFIDFTDRLSLDERNHLRMENA